ncbi:MAG: T9SS type A sorting domain-containing protein [Bacteroidetes bacterium]|nr:T9SS type A sorting domain-containing protein [Bacteroidota bacterium]
MKKSLSLTLLLSCFLMQSFVFGQPWLKQALPASKQQAHKPNFFDVQEKFKAYWDNRSASLREEENAEEGGYQQFKRWEWFMKQRTFPSGEFFSQDILFKEYKKYQQFHPAPQSRIGSTGWSFIGPNVVPGNGGGSGRVNVIRFLPTNPSVMFLGAACGGLWQSNDGGQTWSTNTDLLPALSIADMAINTRNPDTMYIATGDGYGYEYLNDFWGGTYSAGVLMSVDGGLTWNSTGLSYAQSQNDIIQRIVVHPTSPEIVMIATRNGIFRSVDGGASWLLVESGHFHDIEFNTGNPDMVYATNETDLFRSVDRGSTWTSISAVSCFGRISIATTAANPLVIYALCENGTFFRSDDGGFTLNAQGSPGTTFYGYYDAVLAASQVDENTVYCGGVGVVKSIDGGVSWNSASSTSPGSDYVHADNHFIDFFPGSNTRVYSGNDGGIFRTDDGGTNWTDLSNTLAIKQYYRMTQSATDPYLIYAGAQDNGTDRLKNGIWDQVYGADGMECIVDYSNDDNVFVSAQNGYLQHSTDGGASFNYISPSSGAWITPYIIDPINPQTLYAGFFDVQKTTDAGASWNSISSSISFVDNVIALAISRSDNNVIYAASLGTIFRTDNGGVSWDDITAGLPVASCGITYIAVCDTNPHKVWVSFTGYTDGEKVYSSIDGGANWTNVSGTLPNIPVNCIVYQNQSDEVLYIGTDFGVFSRDAAAVDWTPFNSGLPNVIVHELEIHYGASKLRAATYGRGIWEADLNGVVPIVLDAGIVQIISPAGSSCDALIVPEVKLRNFGSDTLLNVNINYRVDNGPVQVFSWVGVLPTGTEVNVSFPSMSLSNGAHTLTVYTSDPNGGADQYAFNDSRVAGFVVNSTSSAVPFTEGFQSPVFPPQDWTISNSSSVLRIDTTTGGFGLSSQSMYANFYYINSGNTGQLITPRFDLSGVLAPAFLSFNLAYAPYSFNFSDSLVIYVSLDCGLTYQRIYEKGPIDLATTGQASSVFIPLPNEWRRDSIDISSFIGNTEVFFRFDAKSGNGNSLYLDDINLNGNTSSIPGAVNEEMVSVYPNPFTSVIGIFMTTSGANVYTLELHDLAGRLVLSKEIYSNGGFVNTELDLSKMESGMYQYRILQGKRTVHGGKLVKS